jgi:hypothetical protein
MKFVLFLLTSIALNGFVDNYSLLPFSGKYPYTYGSITILDAKYLHFKDRYGKTVTELSGLAYCLDGLYAVSDNGYLYHFFIDISDDTIGKLTLQNSFVLRDEDGVVLSGDNRDAEGLSSYYGKLLISFERKERIVVYSKHAIALKDVKLNKHLRNLQNYQGKNKGLESVAYSPKYGIVTAPENRLKTEKKKYHTLYARNSHWKFQADGSITSIDFIDEDTVLVLMRKYKFMQERFTSLVRVHLNWCDKKRVCQSEVLAKFESSKGWHIDNFEGLCKVDTNRFLMISDDNDSLFQKTLLVLFEIRN